MNFTNPPPLVPNHRLPAASSKIFSALSTGKPFDGKVFNTYEEKDGLCGQIISAVSEDADHKIIIGSKSGGLCKFDGHSFFTLEEQHKEKYSFGDIKFITVDDNDNTIIGKDNQILKYSKKGLEILPIKSDTLKSFVVNCFLLPKCSHQYLQKVK